MLLLTGPFRRVACQLVEPIDRPARAQEIADVALFGQPGYYHNLDACGLAMERPGNLPGMIAADLVVVRDDQAGPAAKDLGVAILPLAGPHQVAGRQSAGRGKVLNVLLAFHDPDGFIRVR